MIKLILKDYRKNKFKIFFIFLQLFCLLFVTNMMKGQFKSEFSTLSKLKVYNDLKIVNFEIFNKIEHKTERVIVDQEFYDYFVNTLDVNNDNAYLIHTDSGIYDNHNVQVLYLIGDLSKVEELPIGGSDTKNALQEVNNSEVKGYFGKNVERNNNVNSISIYKNDTEDTKIPIEDRLDEKIEVLMGSSLRDYDDSIIIPVTFEYFFKNIGGFDIIDMGFLSGLYFIDPSESEINGFMENVELLKIYNTSIYDYNNFISNYIDNLEGSFIYSIYYCIALIFVMVFIICVIITMINNNFKEYAIHMVCGGSKKDILIRIVVFIVSLVTSIVLLVYIATLFIFSFGDGVDINIIELIKVVIFSFILSSPIIISAITKFKSFNLLEVIKKVDDNNG